MRLDAGIKPVAVEIGDKVRPKGIRGCEGKDADMLRQKARYALPRETTAAEQAALAGINSEFYSA